MPDGLASVKPITVPEGTRVVVLFGGSFDPPHRSHLAFARLINETIHDSWVCMVPAARSPFKIDAPGATGEQRVDMLRLGLHDIQLGSHQAGIWTDELDRGGRTSYFIETLRRARTVVPPDVTIRFVFGSDQLAAFHRWRDAHAILSLAAPIILMRGGSELATRPTVDQAMIDDVRQWLAREGGCETWSPEEVDQLAAGLIEGQPIEDTASTQIRMLLTEQSRSILLNRLLTPSVLAYIRREELYKDDTDD